MIELPDYAPYLMKPKRYKVIRGGRGSAKSYTAARLLILKSLNRPSLIVCGREYQNSISDSVHSLLVSQIDAMGLNHRFKIHNTYIETVNKKSKFIFKGLNRNIQSIKSIPGITDFWIEEAQTTSKHSWETIIPTVREPESEIWVTYNPENEDDPTHTKFFGKEGAPKSSILIKANWRDNPWFPDVLIDEKNHMFRTNPDLYMHIWEGETRSSSDAQIFKNKWVAEDFTVQDHFDGPYFGADWGFSVDPTTLIKMWIDLKANKLYIEYEAGGVGIDLPQIPMHFDKIPESRNHVIRADCARPETISYVHQKGFNIVSCAKWTGCVEDGIEFLKSFDKIVVHTRCPETIKEFRNYKYKTERLTGDITTKVEDSFNHRIDAIRYGMEKFIMRKRTGLFGLM